MKNSRTGAKYSPCCRSGTKRNSNNRRISVILMAVARQGGISATGPHGNYYIQILNFDILIKM